MDLKKKNLGLKLILLSILLIPGMQVLFIIGCNSNYLIRVPFFILICILIIALIASLIYGIMLFKKNKEVNNIRIKKWVKIVFGIFMGLYVVGCIFFTVLLYGPNDKFRTWLITTAMQTMDHKYYCKWFYNEDTIKKVMDSNYIKESGESTDASLIEKQDSKYRKDTYENEYEKQILDVDDDIKYQIIELDVNGCNGYLAVVYDPSKVKLAVTQNVGTRGQYVTQMAANSNALLAINGGGFSDPNHNSSGGTPTGLTIQNGQIVTNRAYSGNRGGGLIGFTNDDVLVLLKDTSATEALNMGVRDAVSWGPFLIVNGTPSFIKGNGGWGYAARSAIGQRADGIVLLLVIDSNATRTKGADMVNLTEIMQNYGAVNAANLDGGTSSVMVMPKEIAQSKYNAPCSDYRNDTYCAINDPIDGDLKHQTRPIADAWVVVE